jgi:hypothetical protein
MPGGYRVPLALVGKRAVSGSAAFGYGFTEGILNDEDEHHRLGGNLAAGLTPIQWLAAAVRFDSRYDWHDSESGGGDSGAIGQTRLLLRGAAPLGRGWHLGGEGRVLFPAAETAGRSVDSTTFDINLLASYLPHPTPLTLAVQVGFRVDGTAGAIRDPAALSLADRAALGYSDANAVLAGVFASWRIDDLEILGELGWDVMVGEAAPSALESPVRVSAGGRYHFSPDIDTYLLIGFGPHARPEIADTETLYVIEPLVTAVGGFGFRLPLYSTPEPTAATTDEPKPEEEEPEKVAAKPARVVLDGIIHAPGGAPIENAKVVVGEGEAMRETTSNREGRFTLSGVPAGPLTLRVSAEGWGERQVAVDAGKEGPIALDVELRRPLPEGQIRGQVSGFDGRPIAAAVRVEPIGLEIKSSARGAFEVDVPPGDYEVLVSAPGYAEQRRPARVEQNGVTVLVVNLQREK